MAFKRTSNSKSQWIIILLIILFSDILEAS